VAAAAAAVAVAAAVAAVAGPLSKQKAHLASIPQYY
jgi:hypothetical protein